MWKKCSHRGELCGQLVYFRKNLRDNSKEIRGNSWVNPVVKHRLNYGIKPTGHSKVNPRVNPGINSCLNPRVNAEGILECGLAQPSLFWENFQPRI